MSNLLSIRNLRKSYPGFTLDGIGLDVPAGSIVGLVGSNGAGKTTTIKAALGLIRSDGGSIALLGQDTANLAPRELASLRQRIGIVFDACSFPEELRVGDIGLLMRSCYRHWDQEQFARLLGKLGVADGKAVKDLSRGTGMKLSLACALCHGADLLILDEATAGLDPLARDEALDLLRSFMADGSRGILMSTHITSDLEKVADYVVCIDNGRLAFSVEKDAITDLAGIAQCSASQFQAVADSGFFEPGALRFEQGPYATSVLAPDRFAFARRFGDIAIERASIDSYMSHLLKGSTL